MGEQQLIPPIDHEQKVMMERSQGNWNILETGSPYVSLQRLMSCQHARDLSSVMGPFEVEPKERFRSDYLHRYPPGTRQTSHAAFFMPNHYDYQQGKARKRSNLPKQSTEIMKTWFDQVFSHAFTNECWFFILIPLQNIANPYPSEEQKAIFSNVSKF